MKFYKLSQKVSVGIGQSEWVDIATSKKDTELREYAKKIKEANPQAILGLRSIEEVELEL